MFASNNEVARGWRVYHAPSEYSETTVDPGSITARVREWFKDEKIQPGSPFLLSPSGVFDEALNSFFSSVHMLSCSPHTRVAYALDLARFLTFVHCSRTRSGPAGVVRRWQDVTAADRAAYYAWRNDDPDGPRVSPNTWNREVASVSSYFDWAVHAGHMVQSPMSMVAKPQSRRWQGGFQRRHSETSAESRPDGGAIDIRWLPAASYRRWRDVGLRGYAPSGLPDGAFRGDLAGRDSAYADLMIRTGLRLAEQTALTVFDLPQRTGDAYVGMRLPNVLAKNGSGRRIYYPESVLSGLEAYRRGERAEIVAAAQLRNQYAIGSGSYLVDLNNPKQVKADTGRIRRLDQLTAADRSNTYVVGDHGPEPAALWLTRIGTPMSPRTWQSIFRSASNRCQKMGVNLRCHPHMLRHSYAVITLEQLQRGHLSLLGDMDIDQRRHYRMIFGDPLDWVRQRLGHKSVETTQIYLHVLAELEYETRLALVGDNWGLPYSNQLTEFDQVAG